MFRMIHEYIQQFAWIITISLLIVLIAWFALRGNSDRQYTSNSNTEETAEVVEQTQNSVSLEKTKESISEVKEDSYDHFKKALDSFLEAYYTYDSYGQNYEEYKGFLLPEVRESWKDRVDREIQDLNMTTFVRSEYVSSQFFVSNPSFEESQVICRVRNNFDQLDGKGDFVGITENSTDIMITVKKQGEALYVKEIRGIKITE